MQPPVPVNMSLTVSKNETAKVTSLPCWGCQWFWQWLKMDVEFLPSPPSPSTGLKEEMFNQEIIVFFSLSCGLPSTCTGFLVQSAFCYLLLIEQVEIRTSYQQVNLKFLFPSLLYSSRGSGALRFLKGHEINYVACCDSTCYKYKLLQMLQTMSGSDQICVTTP